MLCCPSCGSRFFKTLELRFELFKKQVQALLYKKRCKRCKQKYLIELTTDGSKVKYDFASYEQWKNAERAGSGGMSRISSDGRCVLVGDYTKLISSDTSEIFSKLLKRF